MKVAKYEVSLVYFFHLTYLLQWHKQTAKCCWSLQKTVNHTAITGSSPGSPPSAATRTFIFMAKKLGRGKVRETSVSDQGWRLTGRLRKWGWVSTSRLCLYRAWCTSTAIYIIFQKKPLIYQFQSKSCFAKEAYENIQGRCKIKLPSEQIYYCTIKNP